MLALLCRNWPVSTATAVDEHSSGANRDEPHILSPHWPQTPAARGTIVPGALGSDAA